MSRIRWDQIGTRQFITGVDRGVLYKADNTGVPWNGLTSVEEVESGNSVTPYYLEGLPFVQTRTPSDFAAVLKAYTYPDEFEVFDGMKNLYNRAWFTGQPVNQYFGLSYRTHMGDDLNTDAPFYQIHILYNLMADPTNRQYNTISDKVTPVEFSWNLTGIPVKYPGIRPTSHLIFDSRYMHPELLGMIEEILYGSDDIDGNDFDDSMFGGSSFPSDVIYPGMSQFPDVAEIDGPNTLDGNTPNRTDADTIVGGLPPDIAPGPRLPDIAELVKIATQWPGITIVDNGDGTWTASGDPMYIKMTGTDTFEIDDAIIDYSDPDTYTISSP